MIDLIAFLLFIVSFVVGLLAPKWSTKINIAFICMITGGLSSAYFVVQGIRCSLDNIIILLERWFN